MRIIGLIGGISWVSTMEYYKLINEKINTKLGGHNYARCIVYSFNFADIKKNNDTDNWASTLEMVTDASNHLINSGAEAIVLCANTMHLIADEVQERIKVPLIHIAEATALEIDKQGLKKVGLLGTKFTMEKGFFKAKLADRNISTIIPESDERDFIHYTVFEEFGRSIFKEETKKQYLKIINQLNQRGAEGIILGCTEIPMLIKPADVTVPVFDTTEIHAEAAVAFSLGASPS